MPLVNSSVPTEPSQPAATLASAAAIPTNPPSPLPTPTLAFARPVTVSASAPISDGQARIANVPILMYHYISDPPPGSDRYRQALSVTPANFEAQMSYLQQAGYHAIALYDVYDYLMQGKPLPEKPIVLTFDDGYVDAISNAMPILQKHGFVGTFFVLTGPADRGGAGGYLTWDHIMTMNAAGMDIELHSREHYDLRRRSNDFLVHQIAGGKESIEAHINRPVRWFAYPSGRYDAAVIRVLKSAGFWGAVTTAYGRTHTASAFFELPRVRISGSYTLETFKKLVADGQ
jgi:peptidoglycan/xylan/chitin deacetylase (PgdA/CDA1 family)